MPSTGFYTQIYQAYKAGLYTDLKITCGSSEFKVHKVVVCCQSKVFHTLCSNGFSESFSNTIDLTEDGISLVKRMVDCLYRGNYIAFCANDDSQYWKYPHQLHAAMYALGDKFDLAPLKEAALAHFNKQTEKSETLDLLGFIESIAMVYSSTPNSDRRLRDVTVEKIKANPQRFLCEDVKAPFQKVFSEVADFSWDLFQHWMSRTREPTPFVSPSLTAPRGEPLTGWGSGTKRRR